MERVLLSTLPIGAYFEYVDDGFGHDPKSDDYRRVEVYGRVVGAPLEKPKRIPVQYGKKDFRPNTGVVFVDYNGQMTIDGLFGDLYVTEVKK